MQIMRGQKVKFSKINLPLQFDVGIALTIPPGFNIDVSCFGVDPAGRLSDDRYLIFYNQKSSPEGALLQTGCQNGYAETFRVDLNRLPPQIRKLVFTATLDGEGTMSRLDNCHWDLNGGGQTLRFDFSGKDFSTEKAIIIGEVYYKDEWRLSGVGQGFAGGLSALLKHFGGEETASLPAPPPLPSTPKVNLGKVTLEKRGQSQKVNLSKDNSERQPIHINLNWGTTQNKSFKGFFGGGTKVDLDLGCMFELTDDSKGVIQPLGNMFGAKNSLPFIFLDKDDRSGTAQDGENMYLFRPDLIRKVVIFAMIYEGTTNFADVHSVLTITDDQRNEIVIPLNSPDPHQVFCVVTLIEGHGDSIAITKEERYFASHKECDQHYGFGFRWKKGSK